VVDLRSCKTSLERVPPQPKIQPNGWAGPTARQAVTNPAKAGAAPCCQLLVCKVHIVAVVARLKPQLLSGRMISADLLLEPVCSLALTHTHLLRYHALSVPFRLNRIHVSSRMSLKAHTFTAPNDSCTSTARPAAFGGRLVWPRGHPQLEASTKLVRRLSSGCGRGLAPPLPAICARGADDEYVVERSCLIAA